MRTERSWLAEEAPTLDETDWRDLELWDATGQTSIRTARWSYSARRDLLVYREGKRAGLREALAEVSLFDWIQAGPARKMADSIKRHLTERIERGRDREKFLQAEAKRLLSTAEVAQWERERGFSVPPPGNGRWTCIHCPVQAEGTLPDGRVWYFRARGGWSFGVGKDLAEAEDRAMLDADACGSTEGYEGWMSALEASKIIADCLTLLAKRDSRLEDE